MQPVVAGSARKHGVPDRDMLHAFANAIDVFDMDDGFTMLIGSDDAGRLIEVGVVDGDRGAVIVHAMRPARQKFLRRS